ncbi:lipopolysaccharide transferase family protein [Haloferax mucosum ATCC BAA-1512]|uniref:Lipopolysaccharide transferase family protein n=1 Tax=Haloferax mucosum ATCC BAA-1512 TaxID=662479 RepID=M0IRF2_9EURY|nr:glycosyltransferase family 4 protein [Haloferax mucosum]ELZ98024.1 lipopolysaccharide transferase family protein [Haloferax mucosum ATCC BAA-1512]
MHVVYIIGQDSGGLPHYAAELANAVSKHAHVTVLKPTDTSADELFRDAIDVRPVFEPLSISMPKLYTFGLDPRDVYHGLTSYNRVKQVSDLDPDIVHDPTDLFPHVKFFIRRHGIDRQFPLLTTRHEIPPNPFSLARPPIFAESLVDLAIPDVRERRVVVHTKRQREVLLNRGYDEETVRVIPHGAYSVFGNSDDVRGDPDPNTLLFFGNIVPPKGLPTLVEAIPKVARDIPEVTLIIAGDGKISKRSRRIIDRHEANFEVHNEFVPNDRVKTLFSRATLVALPYRSQQGTKGHSGVLATAFSFGKPVVASSASEFPELVADSGAGVVVPPADPDRLATAITSVLSDDDARATMARHSRAMADRLSWDAVAEQYLDVYETIVEADRLPGHTLSTP